MFGLDLEKKPVEEVDEVSERADDVWHAGCDCLRSSKTGVAMCGGKFVPVPMHWSQSMCPLCHEANIRYHGGSSELCPR